ncbi:TlyA family rRNA (cytidine-2'-O)-methyltransferase [Candidatus Peregrinibacteria bacterium HGW-Peregrinibacteria-1]|jgi:23S rRNA (cytidine1920-2'-O)/16S rRNA (cytidine1409-2'-O)-methyltransferase|nr:MAG: TlyA family rRNA (cytidine-2'-O)-methyltransferase [Candidatus Peregrinibacteria bacterium HGW-Peregrinibacteria-1]
MRIDEFLVHKGECRSRAQGKDFVRLGWVKVNGEVVHKPNKNVKDGDVVEIVKEERYVSRGALKLKDAIEYWNLEIDGKVVADIGASTGGFTDLLLKNGAVKVFAIDVGRGQLDLSLKNDPRVVEYEGVDVRSISDLGEAVDLAVIDVSFISLRMIFEKVKYFLSSGGTILALFKPQFEVGKDFVGKDGVVKDEEKILEVKKTFVAWAKRLGLEFKGEKYCEIKGKKGNQEVWLKFDLR